MAASTTLNRRNILKVAGLSLGAAISPSCRRAIESGSDLAAPPLTGKLSESQNQAITALADLIIPATDTPGAVQAGVPDFIQQIVVDWYTAGERQIFLDGLAELDQAARARWSRPFVGLTTTQQAQLLTELEPPMEGMTESRPMSALSLPAGASGDLPFYVKLKELTVLGFYTSELAATTELDYQPVPGHYDGDARFGDSDRQWTR